MAPCYRKFTLALRLRNEQRTETLATNADITSWLPGDNVFDSAVTVPARLVPGEYELAYRMILCDCAELTLFRVTSATW